MSIYDISREVHPARINYLQPKSDHIVTIIKYIAFALLIAVQSDPHEKDLNVTLFGGNLYLPYLLIPLITCAFLPDIVQQMRQIRTMDQVEKEAKAGIAGFVAGFDGEAQSRHAQFAKYTELKMAANLIPLVAGILIIVLGSLEIMDAVDCYGTLSCSLLGYFGLRMVAHYQWQTVNDEPSRKYVMLASTVVPGPGLRQNFIEPF